MPPFPEQLTTILQSLTAFCTARAIAAWVVGGTARDMALGRVPADLDIAVDTDGITLARSFADSIGAAFVPLDHERGTGRVVLSPDDTTTPRLVIDLVQLRAPTLAEDLTLRDFTVNALALPLTTNHSRQTAFDHWPPDFVDPCGGLRDLAARELRACRPSSIRDDPLRILRALRLAAELDFLITPELDADLRTHVALITQPAAERIRDELLKLLRVSHAAPWLRYLDTVGGLTRLFPELEPARTCEQPIVHFLPVLAHSLEAVVCLEWLLEGLHEVDADPQAGDTEPADERRSTAHNPHQEDLPAAVQTHPHLPRRLKYADRLRQHFAELPGSAHSRAALLKLATLLHDNAKPQTKQPKPDGGVSFYRHQIIGAEVASRIARRLRLSRQEAGYVATIVREHMRPGHLRSTEQVTMRAIVRFFRDTGSAGPDVLLHGLADHMATRGPQIDPEDWHHHLAWTSAMLDTLWQQPPERARPLLNGHELMRALEIEPGRIVGELLREIHEAQAAGDISTPEEALALARRILAERR